MDWHPIQGGVEIFLVASCYGNRDKLWPDGPLCSYADFTFFLPQGVSGVDRLAGTRKAKSPGGGGGTPV